MTRLIQIALLCLMGLILAPMSHAQIGLSSASSTADETPTLPDEMTPETANALVSRLSDSEVRAILLDRLNAQALEQEAATDNSASDFLYHATSGAWSTVTAPVQNIDKLFSGQALAISNFYENIGHGSGLLMMLGYMALVF